jgi:hypothetical protein
MDTPLFASVILKWPPKKKSTPNRLPPTDRLPPMNKRSENRRPES